MAAPATIVVDLQNDYLTNGRMPLQGIDAAIDNAARVVAAAREKGEQVIFIRHEFAGPDAPFFAPGSDGAAIVPALAPRPGEVVIVKNYPNSFLKTDLQDWLDRDGTRDLVVVGAMSHMCIDATVRAASDLGYAVTLVQDACACPDVSYGDMTVPAAQVHATLMGALGFAYANVVSTEDHLG